MAPPGRVAVVTGAPSGVGFNFAVKLLQSGAYARLILAVRNEARGEDTIARLRAATAAAATTAQPALTTSAAPAASVSEAAPPATEITALPCDLASLKSVRAFTTKVAEVAPEVHLLVLNAGHSPGPMFEPTKTLSADGLEATFAVNHLAHWLIATDLVPQLRAAAAGVNGPIARVVVTASVGHSGAILPPAQKGGWRAVTKLGTSNNITAYANTKLANVLLAYDLDRRYRGDGIVANALHPGAIRETNIWATQAGFARTLVDSIMFPVARLLGKVQTVDQGGDALLIASRATQGGQYLDIDTWKPSSPASRDPALAKELWDLSAELVAAALGPPSTASGGA